jgi:hypothetical protein
MLNVSHRSACLLLLAAAAVAVSGCFNLDFGSEDIQGCGTPITPGSVAMSLQDRYALGATTTLSVTGLDAPEIISSNPEVVSVGPVQDNRVTLNFVGVGEASIRVSEGDDVATARLEVARLERFEVLLPFYTDPPLPLAGRAVIDPAFQVRYFDRHGRLYGGGLAETTWERSSGGVADVFHNPSLESGPQQVEVRVGDRLSVIEFEAVAHDEVGALWILETDTGQGRIRVDAVGITASGTQVWNIAPYFDVDGQLFVGSFEYLHDPDANPSTVIAESIPLSINGPLDPAKMTIYGSPVWETKATYAAAAPTGGRAPLMAIISLLLMTLLIRVGVRSRSVC